MIAKNILVAAFAAGFPAVAAAADDGSVIFKVGAKIRVDNQQSTSEFSAAGKSKEISKSSGISLNHAEFTLHGEHGADTLLFSFYPDNAQLRSATITHKLNDTFSLSFGKMLLLALSWENDYESLDQYLYSATGNYTDHDAPGGQLHLSFNDNHSLTVQAIQGESSIEKVTGVLESGDPDIKTQTFGQSGGLTTSIQYRGNINNVIRPLIGYTQVRTSSSKTLDDSEAYGNYGDGYKTMMGAGVQIHALGAVVDLEYDTVKLHKEKNSNNSKDQDVRSVIAQVKYPLGNTAPFVKLMSDAYEYHLAGNEGDVSVSAFVLGLEHKLDQNCRMHAVYTNHNQKRKLAAGDEKTVTAGFNFGVTALM